MMPDEPGQVAWPEAAPAEVATEPAAPEAPAEPEAPAADPTPDPAPAEEPAADPSGAGEPENLNPLGAVQATSNESATLPVSASSSAAVAHGILTHIRAVADEALRELERVIPWAALQQGHGKAGEVIRRNQP